MLFSCRGRFQPWPRTSWQWAKEPELAILQYEITLSFQSIWLILGKYDHLWFWVTGIWAPTFLVKVVTHKLYFSGVTAFSSFSADLRSRLKPPSGHSVLYYCARSTRFEFWAVSLAVKAAAALLRNCILRFSAIVTNYQIWWHLVEAHYALLGFIYYDICKFFSV